VTHHDLPMLFTACAVSGLLYPVPEDVVLLAAGAWLASETADAPTVILVCAAGVFVRDVIAFLSGRALAQTPGRIGGWLGATANRLSPEVPETQALVTARLAAGFRVPMFVAAGALGLSLRKFLAIDLIGVAITTPATVGLGAAIGQVSGGMPALRGLGLVVVVGLGAHWWRRSRAALAH
jgi:membrane protein DedA with SNARE-associated domain